jgi:hypothetical protein
MSEPNEYPVPGAKPGEVTAISITTLISGITNILTGLGWSAAIVLGTFGIGLLCVPLTILPTVLGIFEIVFAAKMLSDPPRPLGGLKTLAVLEICGIVFLNVISLVAGILTLVFTSNPKVREYLAKSASYWNQPAGVVR